MNCRKKERKKERKTNTIKIKNILLPRRQTYILLYCCKSKNKSKKKLVKN